MLFTEPNPIENHYYFPPYITLAHLFHAPQGWHIKQRMLSQYQIQYVVKGEARYTVEGNEYLTKRGDLLLHKPFEKHCVSMIESNPYICISILFHFGSNEFPIHHLFEGNHLKGTFANDAIEQKLSQLIVSYQQQELAQQALCQGLLMQILAELSISNTPAQLTDKQIRNKAKMILLRNYITENYEQNIQLENLEELSGFHRNSILREFKRSFNESPIQYLTRIRIEKAKELALQTNLSVTEIAQKVGYADVHSFGKIFKRKTGVSLSQFCAALTFE